MDVAGTSLERRLAHAGVLLVSFAVLNDVQGRYDWGVVLLVPVCFLFLSVGIDALGG